MMPTFVQKNFNDQTTASTTCQVTCAAIGAGNLICGFVIAQNLSLTCTVKDSNNNAATMVPSSSGVNDSTNGNQAWMFYIPGSAQGGGATSITATFSSSIASTAISFQEWSGVQTTSPLDQSSLTNIATSTTPTGTSVTTTAAGELIFAGICPDTNSPTSILAGTNVAWTLRNNDATNFLLADESFVQSAGGSIAAQFRFGATAGSQIGIMTFKAAGAAALPAGTQPSTALPPAAPPGPIDLRTWVWRQVDKLGKDRLPNRQQDWPNPVPPPRIEQTWLWRQTNMFGQDRLPNRQQDWPNPVPPPKIEQTWGWRQTGMFGQDRLPNRQQDWPNPVAPPQIDRTWVQGFSLPLSAVVVIFPHNQYDWPNPLPAPQIDRTWTWTQTRMFGQDRLPFRQQDWPNPVAPPAIQQSWFSSAVLTIPPATTAVCQFDWHLPEGPPGIDRTWIQGFSPLLAVPPQRPFNQFDWPLPPPLPNIDHSWVQPLTVLLATPIPPQPHNQFDWPNPLAPPSIDHFWMQQLLPLITPPPPPVFTGLPASNPFSAAHNFGRLGST